MRRSAQAHAISITNLDDEWQAIQLKMKNQHLCTSNSKGSQGEKFRYRKRTEEKTRSN